MAKRVRFQAPRYRHCLWQLVVLLCGLWLAALGNISWAADDAWTQVANIYGRTFSISALITDNNGMLYAGTSDGVFKSGDGGDTWQGINNGLASQAVTALTKDSKGNLYAIVDKSSVFALKAGGSGWVNLSLNISSRSLAVDNSDNLYIGADLYTSNTTETGIFKVSTNIGITVNIVKLPHETINALIVDKQGNIYAENYGDVFKFSNSNSTWIKTKLSNSGIYNLVIDSKDNLYINTYGGLFKSGDGGKTWTVINVSYTIPGKNNIISVPSITTMTIDNDDNLYANSYYNMNTFKSSDEGASWSQIDKGQLSVQTAPTFVMDSTGALYAGTYGGMYKNNNGGYDWTAINTGLRVANPAVYTITVDSDGNLYAGTAAGISKRGSDNSAWIDIGLPNQTIRAFTVDYNGNLYASIDYLSVFSYNGVFKLGKGTNIWASLNNGLTRQSTDTLGQSTITIYALSVDSSGNVYAGSYYDDEPGFRGSKGGALLLINSGTDSGWGEINTGISINGIGIQALASDSQNNLYAGLSNNFTFNNKNNSGVFKKSSGTYSWNPINNGMTDQAFYALLVDGNDNLYAGTDKGVFKLSNGGGAWTALNNGISNKDIRTLAIDRRGNIYAGSNGGGVFTSSDGAKTWTTLNSGLGDLTIHTLAVDHSGNIYAGTDSGMFQIAPATPITPWTAALTVSGTLRSQTLTASLTPASSDVGQAGCLYIAVILPQNLSTFLLGPNGWYALGSGNLQPYRQGLLATTQATLASSTDLSSLAGAHIYAGYGTGNTIAACYADMRRNNAPKQLYTIN